MQKFEIQDFLETESIQSLRKLSIEAGFSPSLIWQIANGKKGLTNKVAEKLKEVINSKKLKECQK